MKSQLDLVRGLIRKAESDLENAATCMAAGRAWDTICFHSQQAAEKMLKAYLTAHNIEYPFVHNLEKLIDLCTTRDPSFAQIKDIAGGLTPYAVDLRYDTEFWPAPEMAREAYEAARAIKEFVIKRM